MLRTASSLPLTGLLTLGSALARFQAKPPACYRASWQLPGPDFHRQATTSLRTRRNTMALRHGVTSRSTGRTRKTSLESRLAQHVPGDQEALDLAGTFHYSRDPKAAEPVLERQIRGHAHAAQDLHHRVDDIEADFGGVQLGRRCLH